MRRVTLVLAAVAMMVSLFAVGAYAAQIDGTENTETLNESNLNDQIHALVGDDTINAQTFPNDRDRAHGNKGNDTININDGDSRDIAFGGKGTDSCNGDLTLGDKFIGCETINGIPQ
jgi:Ca2+-binding RTX toxin-like protein